MARKPTRSSRLAVRISPDALAIVKRAAEIQGQSLSNFLVAAAQEAAQRTIVETQIIRLSVDDQRALTHSIANPPENRRRPCAVPGMLTAACFWGWCEETSIGEVIDTYHFAP